MLGSFNCRISTTLLGSGPRPFTGMCVLSLAVVMGALFDLTGQKQEGASKSLREGRKGLFASVFYNHVMLKALLACQWISSWISQEGLIGINMFDHLLIKTHDVLVCV